MHWRPTCLVLKPHFEGLHSFQNDIGIGIMFYYGEEKTVTPNNVESINVFIYLLKYVFLIKVMECVKIRSCSCLQTVFWEDKVFSKLKEDKWLVLLWGRGWKVERWDEDAWDQNHKIGSLHFYRFYLHDKTWQHTFLQMYTFSIVI